MKPTQIPAAAADELDGWLGGGRWSATPIAGDASARSYFRIRIEDGSTAVLTAYPPEIRESLGRFLLAHDALFGHVPVPEVFHRGEHAVLQEDVGDRSLTALLGQNPSAARDHYREAASLLESFATVGSGGAAINPAFDRSKFLEELDMTRHYYVERLAGRDSRVLIEPFVRLAERLTSHPYTLCHRDYHGQNIYISNNTLFVIDYQDMRMGPDSYDLASLLRDRGVWKTIGRELESEIVTTSAKTLAVPIGEFRRRYLETLLQRSIKAIGTFARLVVVSGRQQYLAYIGPTLETVHECAHELDEWHDLSERFPFEFKTA